MWGFPVGMILGLLIYLSNVRFAAYITTKGGRHGGYTALFTVSLFGVVLAAFLGLAAAGAAVALYGAGGTVAALIGAAIVKSLKCSK